MGNLHFAKGDLETAEAIFQASLDSSPDFVWALSGLARVRAAEGELDEAIDLYQRAVDQIPLPEFVIALGETQEAAGLAEVASDTYELVEAIQALFEANGVNTDLDLALFTANHGDDPDAAVELARAAYEDQPSIKAADALGWALFKADQLDEAERYAEEALRLGTHDGLYLYHAGMIAKARGDLDTARARLSEAFEVNPHFSPLYEPRAQAALDEIADGS
ncbi:MAG: tetratricopeptide repeat protein [Chloroflexi bacterium]|nr:tetratricopeptide repeat protein [Chloroflexota bacterium]